MGMLSPKNTKGSGKGNKNKQANAPGSKFITKPAQASGFVKKKINTGSQRGS